MGTLAQRRHCALLDCMNAACRGSRWCDRHRRKGSRPLGAALKPGEPKDKAPGPPLAPPAPSPLVATSMKLEAQRHASAAMARLVTNINVGSPSSQIAAARGILGIAGVELQPPANVKHHVELPKLPEGVSVADLLLIVRGGSGRTQPPGPVRPMAILANGAPALPAPAADPPNGGLEAQTVDFIEVPSYDARAGGPPSGSTPDVPGAAEEA